MKTEEKDICATTPTITGISRKKLSEVGEFTLEEVINTCHRGYERMCIILLFHFYLFINEALSVF